MTYGATLRGYLSQLARPIGRGQSVTCSHSGLQALKPGRGQASLWGSRCRRVELSQASSQATRSWSEQVSVGAAGGQCRGDPCFPGEPCPGTHPGKGEPHFSRSWSTLPGTSSPPRFVGFCHQPGWGEEGPTSLSLPPWAPMGSPLGSGDSVLHAPFLPPSHRHPSPVQFLHGSGRPSVTDLPA